MTAIQQLLAGIITNARKPGVVRGMLGQFAILYGSNLVAEVAAEAAERVDAANATLDDLQQAIATERETLRQVRQLVDGETSNRVRAAIRDGHLDDEVRERAAILARLDKPPVDAELLDDGPPETAGAVRDLPGEDPVPPCVDPTCRLDYNHAGPHSPAVPPRMAGGYLSVVADSGPGLLAGDGSDERPYREVDTIASVLHDDGDDD